MRHLQSRHEVEEPAGSDVATLALLDQIAQTSFDDKGAVRDAAEFREGQGQLAPVALRARSATLLRSTAATQRSPSRTA